MRIVIDWSEWYPVYNVAEGSEMEKAYPKLIRDVPDETVARWRKALLDFDKSQDEMREALGFDKEK